MASQSVWGTVESQFLMRRLTLVGVNLLFLWTMSPLGGQASLRLLERSTKTVSEFMPLRYLSTGPGSTVWTMTAGTYVESDGSLTQVQPLYAAALYGSDQVKNGPEDIWGNIKIPFTQDLNSSWTSVPPNASRPEDYRALVGIPVIGRPKNRDATFNLETSHVTIECEPFHSFQTALSNYTQLQRLVPGQYWKNMSENDSPWGSKETNTAVGARATFFLQTDLPMLLGEDGRMDAYAGYINNSVYAQPHRKRQITYASKVVSDGTKPESMNIANCSLGQIHIETRVECTLDKCTATQQRRSLIDTRDENVSPFDHSLINEMVLKAFPKAIGWSRGSSATEQFLFNASAIGLVSPTTDLSENVAWVDLSVLSPEVFSKRLSLLLNTFYQLTIAPNAYLGNMPSNNYSAFGLDTTPVEDIDTYLPSNVTTKNTTYLDWYYDFQAITYISGMYFLGATTNSTVSQTHAIFVCNFAWLSLLLAAATAILTIGVASLVLKWKTLGPEMFGFVTSMTYENRYVRLPDGGSMLNGMERARLLKDVEFCVGDVKGDSDVGHIAFAAGVPLRKLERGRLYC